MNKSILVSLASTLIKSILVSLVIYLHELKTLQTSLQENRQSYCKRKNVLTMS